MISGRIRRVLVLFVEVVDDIDACLTAVGIDANDDTETGRSPGTCDDGIGSLLARLSPIVTGEGVQGSDLEEQKASGGVDVARVRGANGILSRAALLSPLSRTLS